MPSVENNFLVENQFIQYDENLIDRIVFDSYSSNNMYIQNALELEAYYRHLENNEILHLISNISQSYNNSKTDAIILKEDIIKLIDSDNNQLQKLNSILQNAQKLDKLDPDYQSITPALASNKLTEVLDGEKKLVNEENFLATILSGKLPLAFSLDIDKIPIKDNEKFTIHGNSKSTYLKSLLLHICKCTQNYNLITNNIYFSTIYNLISLPEKFVNDDFTSSVFYYSGSVAKSALLTPNSGYAFGGCRGEVIETKGNIEGYPFDCSSFMAKVFDCNEAFSTYHLNEFYNEQLKKAHIEDYQKVSQELESKFDIIKTYSINGIKPGMLWCSVKFDKEDYLKEGKPIAGHTGIVLGTIDDEIIILSCNRNMPFNEGISVEKFKFFKDDSKTLIFNPKN